MKYLLLIAVFSSTAAAQVSIGGGSGGVIGNTVTLSPSGGDDTPAFQAACNALYPNGGRLVLYPASYQLTSNDVACYGAISISGNGATITGSGTGNGSSRGISIASCLSTSMTPRCSGASAVIDRTATGAITAGVFSLTLSNVTGLAAGQTVYMFLGSDPTDVTLPFWEMFNVITNIAGSVVTFDDPAPENIADPAGVSRTHHVWLSPALTQNVTVSDLNFVRDTGSGNTGYLAASVNFGRNVKFKNLQATNTGYGVLGTYYSTNISADSISCVNEVNSMVASSGPCLAGWTLNSLRISSVLCSDVNGSCLSYEGQNRGIVVDTGYVSQGQAMTSFQGFFGFNGNSLNCRVSNVSFFAGSTMQAWTPVASAPFPPIMENISVGGFIAGGWSLANVKSINFFGYRAFKQHEWSSAFSITPSMSAVSFTLPQGIYTQVRIYVTSTTGITNLTLQSSVAINNVVSYLASGTTVDIGAASGCCSTSGFNNSPLSTPPFSRSMVLTTNGTVPANTTGRIAITYLEVDGVTDTTSNAVLQQ